MKVEIVSQNLCLLSLARKFSELGFKMFRGRSNCWEN